MNRADGSGVNLKVREPQDNKIAKGKKPPLALNHLPGPLSEITVGITFS